jgi:hypothetical protein
MDSFWNIIVTEIPTVAFVEELVIEAEQHRASTTVRLSTIPNAGYGLFAARDIVAGEPITNYGGQLKKTDEGGDYHYEFDKSLLLKSIIARLAKKYNDDELDSIIESGVDFIELLDAKDFRKITEDIKKWEGTVMDAKTHFYPREMGRWANSNPSQQNVVSAVMYNWNGPNPTWDRWFIAIRDIEKGEEIFTDYGPKHCFTCGIKASIIYEKCILCQVSDYLNSKNVSL